MEYNDYKVLLETAREEFQNNNYITTESLLSRVLLRNNRIPEVFHMLGTIFYDQGKFNKAISHFKKAIEIDPNYTDASIGLSIILNDLGKYEEAKEVFEKAQTLLKLKNKGSDPIASEKLASLHLKLAAEYFQVMKFDEALEQYQKAFQLTPDRMDLLLEIANCYFEKSDYSKASSELENLLRRAPGHIAAKLKLGKIYLRQKKTNQAKEQFQNIISHIPDHFEAKQLLYKIQSENILQI